MKKKGNHDPQSRQNTGPSTEMMDLQNKNFKATAINMVQRIKEVWT